MDDDGGCRRFILVDDEYKLFFDHHLSGDNTFFPPFDDENGESETRNLGFEFSGESKRSKLSGTEEKPIKNRVSQKRKRRDVVSEAEVSRAFPVATTRESIQRDNRACERRKRKMAEFESARVSRDVPLVNNIQGDDKAKKVSKVNTLSDVPLVRAIQGDNKDRKVSQVNTLWDVPLVRAKETIQRDSKSRKLSDSKVNTLWDVPLARAQETIQRDNKARKVSDSKVNTSRDVPLVRGKEVIQGDNKAKKLSHSKVNTLQDVPLFRGKEVIQRHNKAKKLSHSKVNTLQNVPLFRTKEAIRRGNRIAERRNKKDDETKAAGTSRVNRVTEPKAVDETVPVTQSNKGVSALGTRKKNVAVVDKDYFAWLVSSLKASTTVVPDPTQKQSMTVPQKDLVKAELDTESCSDDDDDMIMVSDSPFLCGESTPFVVSKSKTVIDLEVDSTEDETISCLFTKELMDVLERPYDEGELLRLYGEVSEKKQVTRCRELRKGRESNYETSEFGPSYLEKVSDFDKEYRRVDGDDDKERLKLLRGFFFYLKNVTRAGSFKPWSPENQKKLMDLKSKCCNHKKV
ncbi:unnamed protein product [Eruca vesicaria subsp. sativa]|uniref:Uncharacterized protein n=1 Tax=Eruca vesicaria subsp. sativa TaxID=29727 RepID=A0ABC8KKP0_ERUVS|nr:unnamed protein product [Eruca vesicaria subsp. sativa]